MSFDWVKDIAEMQYKYGVKAWMLENQDDKEKMRKYLEFRINFLREELHILHGTKYLKLI